MCFGCNVSSCVGLITKFKWKTKTYLDIQSLHHLQIPRDRSIGKFQLHSHSVHFFHREIEHIHCNLHIQLIEHHRRNLQGSRSDDRPQGLYIMLQVHMRLNISIRWCRHIHRRGFLRNLRGIDRCSFQDSCGNQRWFHRRLVARIHRCLCKVLLHLPENLPYTYMRSEQVDYSTLRFQRILRQLMDLDTRQYLKKQINFNFKRFSLDFLTHLRSEDHLPRIQGNRYM